MSEINLISPLLDGMELVRCLGASGGISLHLLRHTRSGEPFILKHISIPESQTQVEALLLTGGAADEEGARRYYEQVAADYEDQLAALDSLQGCSNCATYLGHQVCAKEEGIGFELYLLSECWMTLPVYVARNAMTHLKALNLGLDLCTALCELRAKGLIHRDVKPENIYLNALGGFMLGDLGVARISRLKYCPMPDRMISPYTAPEIADALSSFNTTVDIYSVGMVLYRILNGNHGPFEDENTSSAAANKRRTGGEALPSPLYADYELAAIVLKACAFEPADRYQTPEEMLQELALYMKRNNVRDSLIVPPINAGEDTLVSPDSMDEPVEPVRFADVDALDEQFKDSFAPDLDIPELMSEPAAQPVFAAPHTRHVELDEEEPAAPEKAPPKRKRARIWIPISISLVLLCAIAAGAWYLLHGGAPVTIASLDAAGRGVDYLTVAVGAPSDAALTVSCTDTYGNVQTVDYTGQPVTFSDLASGAMYSISVSSREGRRLTGETNASIWTVAATEIVDFSATPALAGQVELSLTVSGPDPGEWTVRYNAGGEAAQEVSFTGKTVTIFNLKTDTHYTFELIAPEGIVLRGVPTVEFTTAPEVLISNLKAEPISGSAVRASWTCGESQPAEWTVTCTGPDGTSKTQFVSACEAEFLQLASGEEYTISVTAPGVHEPATATVTPVAAEVRAIHAEAQGPDALHVSWESGTPNGEWLLRYTPKGAASGDLQTVTGSETTLTGLIPGLTYEVELRSPRDEPLGDAAKTEAALPAPADFDAYGASRFFMGTFLLPDKADWGRMDLNPGVTEFSPGEQLVFAVDSFTGHEESEDEVRVAILVEDAGGVPVSAKSYTDTWDSLWESGVIIGVVDEMPREPGGYVVRLYLNGCAAAAREFTMLAETPAES